MATARRKVQGWPAGFPSEGALRKDIELMVQAAKEVLLKTFNKKQILGIYFKGSASKKWDSVIDYVPEVSDIDIHVLMRSQADYDKHFSRIENVIKFSQQIERAYLSKNKKPAHLPLLQVLSLNDMHREKEYVPGLASNVHVIYGKPFHGYTKEEYGRDFQKRGRAQLLEHEPVLAKIRKRGIYKYGKHLRKYIIELSWRLSSSGPNFLNMKGYSFEDAWTLNRTAVVREMRKLGFAKLAKEYHDFYLQSGKHFVAGDSESIRKAVVAGYKATEIMVDEAKKKSSFS
jgi:hypothetical protein